METAEELSLSSIALACVNNCQQLISEPVNYEIILIKLDSLLSALHRSIDHTAIPWVSAVINKLEVAISILEQEIDGTSSTNSSIGHPRFHIPVSNVEFMLSVNFKATDIAKFYGVSKETIFRRMRAAGISVNTSRYFLYLV